MSDDLTARLRHAWDERERQLDEDERVAREASRFEHDERPMTPTGEHWQWVEGENDRVIPIDPVTDEYVGESLDEFRVSLRSVEEYPTNMPYTLPHFVIPTAEEVPAICGLHIARWDPARVLAEVERGRRDIAAKRHILDRYEDALARRQDPEYSQISAHIEAEEYEGWIIPELAAAEGLA